MGTNLQESTDWFKLTNGILNIKGNIIHCEVSVLHKLYIISSPVWNTSDMRQAQSTNNTPSPPSNIRKERSPGYEVSFMTKY